MSRRMQKVEGDCLTLSIEEAAAKLGVSRDAGYRAAKRGQIPVIEVGRLKRVPRARFERLLNEGE